MGLIRRRFSKSRIQSDRRKHRVSVVGRLENIYRQPYATFIVDGGLQVRLLQPCQIVRVSEH
jgi:hypothetical protein